MVLVCDGCIILITTIQLHSCGVMVLMFILKWCMPTFTFSFYIFLNPQIYSNYIFFICMVTVFPVYPHIRFPRANIIVKKINQLISAERTLSFQYNSDNRLLFISSSINFLWSPTWHLLIFLNQVTSTKIAVTMMSKVVTAWRVELLLWTKIALE